MSDVPIIKSVPLYRLTVIYEPMPDEGPGSKSRPYSEFEFPREFEVADAQKAAQQICMAGILIDNDPEHVDVLFVPPSRICGVRAHKVRTGVPGGQHRAENRVLVPA